MPQSATTALFSDPNLPSGNEADTFLDRLKGGQIALGLFEALPGVMFWIKDGHGKIVFANRAYAGLLQKKPQDLVGRTDAELFPAEIAIIFQEDDARVFATGEAQPGKLELVTRPGGGIEWRMTTKIPLLDLSDAVIGTAGISRRLEHGEGPPMATPQRAFSNLLDFINDSLDQHLTVKALAQKAGMSVSSLERRFREHLGTSPRQYVIHARMAAASEHLLNTTLGVGQIANSLGYQEHASFTRAFHSVMHMSPQEYREFYR